MPKIQTQESFSASHFVQTADPCSPCRSLHGHTWKIMVIIDGKIQEDGMVIDFRQIKSIIKKLDHKTLIPVKLIKHQDSFNPCNVIIRTTYSQYSIPQNNICALPIESATAENLAEYFLKAIQEETFIGNEIIVRVYESENSFAEASSCE